MCCALCAYRCGIPGGKILVRNAVQGPTCSDFFCMSKSGQFGNREKRGKSDMQNYFKTFQFTFCCYYYNSDSDNVTKAKNSF